MIVCSYLKQKKDGRCIWTKLTVGLFLFHRLFTFAAFGSSPTNAEIVKFGGNGIIATQCMDEKEFGSVKC